MATFIFSDASVTINSVDLSDHVKSVSINYGAENPGDTNMGDTTQIAIGGLFTWSIDVEFSQDYAASKVDATLFSLVGSTTTILITPVSGAVSSTNPSFTGTGMLESYTGITGSVGDLATATATFVNAGTLVRATS